jgi:NACHT domain
VIITTGCPGEQLCWSGPRTGFSARTGLEVYPDADGPAGARRRAELDAAAAHRRRLAERDGLLEYALLADDLPPLRYEQLAESFQVSVMHESGTRSEAEFLAVARRWPRMLLTGLPGTGKSTALRQLAARWAANQQAPVPILVPLLEVAQRRPRTASDVTLSVLIEAGTITAPESERVPLWRALSQAASRGEAVLLLDGLDECRDLRAVVADGLAAVADHLPAETGILLTTRDCGRAASGRLSFPEARMTEPNHLERPLNLLLQHAGRHRIPEASRAGWVRVRQEWLDEARRDHSDLWQIPLLATLITLLAAQREPQALPASRARVLTEVVRDSVERWEHARGGAAAGGPLGMRAEMLTDGFSEIAHGLTSRGSLPAVVASRLVAAMLSHRWGLSPGEAGAAAGDVLRFWDDHVGVFVSSPASGQVEARSRVFAEIGDAMWVTRQDGDIQGAWVRAALADEDRGDTLILAACLSRDVSGILAVEVLTPEADPAAVLTLADAASEGAVLTAATTADLLGRLVRTAVRPPESAQVDYCRDLPGEQPSRGTRTGREPLRSDRAWPYVRRAAMLRLPSSQHGERRSLLAELKLTGDHLLVATALAVLADALADSRTTLESADAFIVQRLLESSAAQSDNELLPGHIVTNYGVRPS